MSGIRSLMSLAHRPPQTRVLVLGPVFLIGALLASAALTVTATAYGEAESATGVTSAETTPTGATLAELPATGVVEGTVIRPERPRRRVAERYPAAARGPAREPPPVPTVVHLEGDHLPRAGARAADQVRIAQRDTAFVPATAVVPVGTSVAFPNEDPFFHSVFSYSRPKRFDLGRFPQGDSRSVVFDQPGYVKVLCEVHQWMRAGILVVESPFHAVVDDDGSFRLEGVPAGRHTLVVTDFDRGTREVEVTVPEGGQVQVRVELEG